MNPMGYRFEKHYTRQEARDLLPQIRQWLKVLLKLTKELQKSELHLRDLRKDGSDLGGDWVNKWVRTIAEIKTVLLEFYSREIQIKDLERGLVDFPAFIDGNEVFLCWEEGEADIEFWHPLDAGFAGRERIEGTE
jgi:hypothetical protein